MPRTLPESGRPSSILASSACISAGKYAPVFCMPGIYWELEIMKVLAGRAPPCQAASKGASAPKVHPIEGPAPWNPDNVTGGVEMPAMLEVGSAIGGIRLARPNWFQNSAYS